MTIVAMIKITTRGALGKLTTRVPTTSRVPLGNERRPTWQRTEAPPEGAFWKTVHASAKQCMALGLDHRGGDQRAPPGGAFVLTAFDGARGARAKAVKNKT